MAGDSRGVRRGILRCHRRTRSRAVAPRGVLRPRDQAPARVRAAPVDFDRDRAAGRAEQRPIRIVDGTAAPGKRALPRALRACAGGRLQGILAGAAGWRAERNAAGRSAGHHSRADRPRPAARAGRRCARQRGSAREVDSCDRAARSSLSPARRRVNALIRSARAYSLGHGFVAQSPHSHCAAVDLKPAGRTAPGLCPSVRPKAEA